MKSRRDILKMFAGAGLAVPAAMAVGGLSPKSADNPNGEGASDEPEPYNLAETSDPPWALISPHKSGSEVALGWSVASLSGLRMGSYVLELSHADGRAAVVHMCKRDEFSSGAAQTGQVDLVVMNGGEGADSTDEDLAKTLQVLAVQMHENERFVPPTVLARLMSHEDRVETYANDARFQGALV